MNSDYVWLTEMSQQFLDRDYLLPGQSLDERVDIICNTAESILGIKGFAARFKANIKKGWYSLSTPIWANFGAGRSLPISCFGSYMEDKTEDILYAASEVGMMTKHGGGTSAYFGNLRNRGAVIKNNGFSSGAVHFMSLFEMIANIISQGGVRRGSFAAYLPIDHGDIEEFLAIRSEGHPIQDVSFGVTVPDYWMKEMIGGDSDKRKIWAKVLQSRANTGYPYIFFSDNVNNNAPQVYKDKGMKITHSNLCAEICLADNADESFVCDLSSMNALYG
jgi:ribonucleoside-diphosphate reductase alpha chain